MDRFDQGFTLRRREGFRRNWIFSTSIANRRRWGATPPTGAGGCCFDGHNLDAWVKKAGKDWLKEDGPAQWKIVDGTMEVAPGTDCIITHQKIWRLSRACRVSARWVIRPTVGVFLEDRYEANINETYGVSRQGSQRRASTTARKNAKTENPSELSANWLGKRSISIFMHRPLAPMERNPVPRGLPCSSMGVKIYDNQSLDLPHRRRGALRGSADGADHAAGSMGCLCNSGISG